MNSVNYNQKNQLLFFYFIFALSGFTGLIYESIWSHYLKLFLGHAAYAQTLVLAIFMGGMALGAWLSSKYSTRWKNLFFAYALVELIIGIAAIFFHTVFDQTIHYAYNQVLPGLSSVLSVTIFKWSLSSLLILPQSILLGMTFPLMSASIIRRFPQTPGARIAMLYFSNSIGATIGVIVSGFFLIDYIGLPGTIQFAGVVNILLAIIVWLLVRKNPPTKTEIFPEFPEKEKTLRSSFYVTLFLVAFLTGTASFIYEISWIRMLSLVLGSSTHAFELMLSAFILGLALGGLWIKRRIDSYKNPVRALANIQLIMGVLALLTLPLYGNTFELMQWILKNVPRSDSGYSIFNLSSHAIAMMIMLPTTIFAGMTLPLITFTLLNKGGGEKSIGAVYAANTVGAIAGIFFAIHIGMPQLGLKGLIIFGAGIDILLGIALLIWITKVNVSVFPAIRSAAALLAITVIFLFVDLDGYKMASGVYRQGNILTADNFDIIFHKDGKTATVDLTQGHDGVVGIRTNGKVDASINLLDNEFYTADEATMILAAAIPLAINPAATTAANIGLGSGLTTHTLLSSSTIKSVDTIEIEAAMVDAAEIFRPKVELAYTSKKGQIHIDDAKTFFSNHNKKYDIIISEPSNPWVSGTANLFTTEFYQHVNHYLEKDGLLVQWIQLYEIDFNLVTSVLKALSENYSDYQLFASNTSDILIIARQEGKLTPLDPIIFSQEKLAGELARIDFHNIQDLNIRRVASKKLLTPLLPAYIAPANSDYYPYLDLNAARARFLNANALELIDLTNFPLPILEMLDIKTTSLETKISLNFYFPKTKKIVTATNFLDLLTNENFSANNNLSRQFIMYTQMAAPVLLDCDAETQFGYWLETLFNVALNVMPYLTQAELDKIWRNFEPDNCWQSLSSIQKKWVTLFKAVSNKNAAEMANFASSLLKTDHNVINYSLSDKQRKYLLAAGILGHLALNKELQAKQLWEDYAPSIYKDTEPEFAMKLLLAHSQILL